MSAGSAGWRNVLVLAVGQTLGVSGIALVVFLGGIVGAELADDPAWATLPVSLMVVGTAGATVPAALFMRRVGRRNGFLAASVVASLAACAAAAAVAADGFILFCAATALIGADAAFIQQYRFAAAESVGSADAGKAVSFVLAGGILAGFLGPELGRRGRDLCALGPWTGSFFGLAALFLLSALALLFLGNTTPPQADSRGGERPLSEILREPVYVTAILAGVVSYGVMSYSMTAAPISMHRIDLHSLASTTRVFQSHVMAMYVPTLFTGTLVRRLGLRRVMLLGVLALFLSVAFAVSGRDLARYWAAMVLLGIGWNFLFIGGTALVTRNSRSSERFKVQGVNDFLIFGIQALVSFSAGAALAGLGWTGLQLLILPALGLMVAVLIVNRPAVEGR